jgi:hypothetical protein
MALIVVAMWAAPGLAQPRITNARLTSQSAGSSLSTTVRTLTAAQTEAAWIGYSAPVVAGDRVMCCFDSGRTWTNGAMVGSDGACCGACRLEPAGSTSMTTRPSQTSGSAIVKLEGSGQMTVLLRVDDKRVQRVRVFSEECALDAGGRPVVWLENVRPGDSVAFLESLVTGQADGDQRDRLTEGAVSAIALHADAAADAALERLVAPGQSERIRRAVPFWLGNSRGRRGFDVLRRLVKEDASGEVRKKAVFGLSQSAEPGAIDTMIDTARTNDQATVRGEAIFWLGQKAGQKAAAAITERIEQDPDTEVKKRAVFALSQLPKDEGVPLLITVARTHSNPAVKKQAMFWLGQSRDPRALEFFAEILK